MKKFFLLIPGLIVLLFTSNVIAQYKFPTRAEIQRFMHDMVADNADKWSYSGGLLYPNEKSNNLDFNVWLKARSLDTIPYSFYFRVAKKTIYGQLYKAVEMELATTSITRKNANKYRYQVMTRGGRELVPWSNPSVFRSNKYTSYAYLGKFDCRHETIILTIVEKGNENVRSVYVYNSDDKNPAKIKNLMVEYPTGLIAKNTTDLVKGFTIYSAKDPQNVQLEIENTGQNELYHVYLKREFDGKQEIIAVGNGWEQVMGIPNPSMRINNSFFSKPGKYTLIIRPEMRVVSNVPPIIMGSEATAHFTVNPSPATATIPLNTVIFIILAILVAALRIYFYLRRKQKIATQGKQIAVLQLQSVRSQLNPHFIFNALAGIQNLMNKNEVENANKYLARFARLTRNVLDDGQKELTSIEHEVSLLTDYLEMEQMRFGFKFNVDVDAVVDQQIEIPAMLLQPFVENAVKHGISGLKGEGLITVNINKTDNDILLKVTDNGKGFSKTPTTGMGIKLCEERIKLFNSIYKNTSILLHINSTDKGAVITIELKNWL